MLPVPVPMCFRNHISMSRAVTIGAIAATILVVFTAPALVRSQKAYPS